MGARILSGPEIGNAARYDHLSAAYVRHRTVMKSRHEFMPYGMIASRQHQDELIPACPVHVAVLKQFPDEVVRFTDIFVPGFMAVGVIYFLQPVHVTDHDREIPGSPFRGNVTVELLFFHKPGMFIEGPGHAVQIGEHLAFFGSPVHI